MNLLQAVDLSWIPHFKDEPVAIIMIGLLAVIGIFVWRVLPGYLQKRTEMETIKSSKEIEMLKQACNDLIKSATSRLDRIEQILEQMNKQSDDYIEARKNTLKAIIYNNAPILERLGCFNEYLKLGGNGNCLKFCISLIVKNEELWESILNSDKTKPHAEYKEYYKEALAEIKRNALC